MRILIFTLGSRGDVQPYLALAVGLQRAGRRFVTIPGRWACSICQDDVVPA
jgi:UDP:flavonoid glycosyltransferase YjiC (YdhE family)